MSAQPSMTELAQQLGTVRLMLSRLAAAQRRQDERVVRIETRLVKLLAANGLNPDGNPHEDTATDSTMKGNTT